MAAIRETTVPGIVTINGVSMAIKGSLPILEYVNPSTPLQVEDIAFVVHRQNDIKGIPHGALGLPSETREPGEDPDDTLLRCFREELGIEDPQKAGLRHVRSFPYSFEFNGGTIVGADVSIWQTYSPLVELSDPSLLDKAEVHDHLLLSPNQLLSDHASYTWRKNPDSRDLLLPMYALSQRRSMDGGRDYYGYPQAR